jgi:hypothetical protein
MIGDHITAIPWGRAVVQLVQSPPLVESTVESTAEAVLKRTPSYFSTYSKWASLLERVLARVNHSVITIYYHRWRGVYPVRQDGIVQDIDLIEASEN